MPIYEFSHCGQRFEVIKPMSECAKDEPCPECGSPAQRVYSSFHDIWGWILTEKSHHKGAIDTWVEARPSNDPIVDSEKAPYAKTVF